MKSGIALSSFNQTKSSTGTAQNVIFYRALLLGVLIACMTSHAQAQDRVGTIITGRAEATVLKKYSDAALMPKPQIVLIENFRMTGDVITDPERTHRHHLLHKQSQPLTRDELISAVQNSFATSVIDHVKKLNVDVERSTDPSKAKPSTLVVEGEFSLIDQGVARKRIVIGFGRGASDVKAHVLISLLDGDKKTPLLECNINSESGKEPGAVASTSGVGFAISAVTGSMTDKRSSTAQVDGQRMGKLVAEQVSNLMRTTAWNEEKNMAENNIESIARQWSL
jgi:Domain of unknown function (DUF4410)